MNATRLSCCALAVLGFAMPLIASSHEYRLVVKFASECCGTDNQAAKQLADVISGFEKQLAGKITFERISWGKEGEYNQCFLLQEMNDQMKDRFVATVKSSVSSRLVKIGENVACKGGW